MQIRIRKLEGGGGVNVVCLRISILQLFIDADFSSKSHTILTWHDMNDLHDNHLGGLLFPILFFICGFLYAAHFL